MIVKHVNIVSGAWKREAAEFWTFTKQNIVVHMYQAKRLIGSKVSSC